MNSLSSKPLMLVLSSPSGAGKTTLSKNATPHKPRGDADSPNTDMHTLQCSHKKLLFQKMQPLSSRVAVTTSYLSPGTAIYNEKAIKAKMVKTSDGNCSHDAQNAVNNSIP